MVESYYMQPELWRSSRFEEDPDHRMRARLIAALVRADAERVLDVGCGNGFITRLRGTRVLGCADWLPFEARSFDAVVCTEVLEHLPPHVFAKAVTELIRVAKTHLIIGVPYRQDLRDEMAQCAACGRRYHLDLHQHTFCSPEDITRLFSGFVRDAVILMSERVETRSRLYRLVRYCLMGPDAKLPFARCPDCGAKDTIGSTEQAGGKVRRWIFGNLGWRMAKKSVPRWLIVLLRRAGGTDA